MISLFPFISNTNELNTYLNINYSDNSSDLNIISDDEIYYVPNNHIIIFTENLLVNGVIINDGYIIFRDGVCLNGGKIINNNKICILTNDFSDIKYQIDYEIDINKVDKNGFTGFIIDRDINSDEILVILSTPTNSDIKWEKKFKVNLTNNKLDPFYFSDDFGRVKYEKIKAGQRLYCDNSILEVELNDKWNLKIIF